MKKVVYLSLFFALAATTLLQAQPFYLRSTAGPCDFGNSNATCELTDPDMDGIYELVTDFGGPVGRQEFKIYDAGADQWYPGGSNAWFNHQSGSMTFRFYSAFGEVEAVEPASFSICAPGDFSGWNNAASMTNTSGNEWCYTVPSPGSYFWKPTYCASWDSWMPNNGERSVNSNNWFVTTTSANEQVCVTYDPATGRVMTPPPSGGSGVYLRSSVGPCDFGNSSATCELTDPDMDGVFELTYDFGGATVGRQEFKIYDANTDMWYPGGSNAWFDHTGGSVTFRWNSATGEVEAAEGTPLSICAPGAFSGWNNAEPMQDMGNGLWCYTIPTAGTYEWKPTFCGRWDSWQPSNGERSVNAANWSITTTYANQQMCLSYDLTTGQVSQAQLTAIPTMGQWGFILFTLIMVIFGMVILRQQKLVLAGSKNLSFNLLNLPFDKKLFSKTLMGTAIGLTLVFILAILFFGYEMTNADVPGSLLAIPLVAYIAMLLGEKEKQ